MGRRPHPSFHLEHRVLEFLLLQVDEEGPQLAAPEVMTVLRVAEEQRVDVIQTLASTILLVYVSSEGTRSSEAKRRALARHLENQLADSARGVHGRRRGYLGVMGSGQRKHYVVLIPHLQDCLEQLGRLNFGEFREV